MSAAAFASHVADWRHRRPELALALPYIEPARRDALAAFAAIAQQWQDDVAGIGEASVLQAKLAWWAEELVQARRGESRHPLAMALFALPVARALPEALWLAPVEAGLDRHEVPPAADLAAQLRQAAPFHGALAALETALWFGAGADPARATRLAALAHLLDTLPRLDGGMPDALPMNLLARHALDRESLCHDGPARDAAVRDQLADLQYAHRDAISLPGPVSLFRSLGAHADRRRLARARRARRPLPVLALAARPDFSLAWQVWRDARRLRREPTDNTSDS